MNNFPKIKFCGLAKKEQVAFAIKNNIYWAGFIYVKGSSRFISYEDSKNIISSFKNKINFVGVYVNPDNNYIKLVLDPLYVILELGQNFPTDSSANYINAMSGILRASLAWILPTIPAIGPSIPSASQFRISSDGIPW